MSEAERAAFDEWRKERALTWTRMYTDYEMTDAFLAGRASRDPEVTELRAKVDELETTLSDEEVAHADTVRLWQEARESLRWAMEEVKPYRATWTHAVCQWCHRRGEKAADVEHAPACPYALARQRAGMEKP